MRVTSDVVPSPAAGRSVSLVLPALNEGGVIGPVVEGARAALERLTADFEIIEA